MGSIRQDFFEKNYRLANRYAMLQRSKSKKGATIVDRFASGFKRNQRIRKVSDSEKKFTTQK
jgi:hypothetical protein